MTSLEISLQKMRGSHWHSVWAKSALSQEDAIFSSYVGVCFHFQLVVPGAMHESKDESSIGGFEMTAETHALIYNLLAKCEK